MHLQKSEQIIIWNGGSNIQPNNAARKAVAELYKIKFQENKALCQECFS